MTAVELGRLERSLDWQRASDAVQLQGDAAREAARVQYQEPRSLRGRLRQEPIRQRAGRFLLDIRERRIGIDARFDLAFQLGDPRGDRVGFVGQRIITAGQPAVQRRQRPSRVDPAAETGVPGKPAHRLLVMGVGALFEIVPVKLVGRRRGDIFAGNDIVEIARQGGALAEHRTEAAQLQPVGIPGSGRRAAVQNCQRRRLVLADRLVQVMGQVEKSLGVVGGVRRARERLDLFTVGRRPIDRRRAVRGDRGGVEGQQQRPLDANVLQEQRQLRMKGKSLPREHAHFAPQQFSAGRLPFQQAPQLRLDRQERVLALGVRPAADFQLFMLKPLADGR